MNSAAKLFLPLLLIAGAGAGIYYVTNQPDAGPPAPGATQPADPAPEQPKRAPEPVDQQTAEVRTEEPRSERTQVQTFADSGAGAPQGVRGRVLLPNGQPAANIPVYLLQSATSNPLELYLASRKGEKVKPVAQTSTDGNGLFALGAQKAGDAFDVRVVSDDYPELHHRNLKIFSGEWVDTPDLQLQAGVIVQGRVLDEAAGFPIAGAQVFLNNPTNNYQMLATPGRERGILAMTDANGWYKFTNAPRDLPVTVGAEAPEYAYAEVANQPIRNDGVNEFELKLARGLPISGIVVDANGKPIPRATILAAGQSAKTPQQATTTSNNEGLFELPTLREGPYQLTVSASGFEELIKKPVLTGETDVKLVLEQRGLVRLRVLSAQGVPVKSYRVSLKRWFPNNPSMQIGKVPEFRDLTINPGDYEGDWAIVRNVPVGDFVFQIIERSHAKTLTPPFKMTSDPEGPSVEVTLTMGASITGTVVDDRGAPVRGATVVTDMNGGFAADSDFFSIFRQFLPDKHTVETTTTDAQGRFTLRKLAFADYMLRVSHADFCEGAAQDIKLESEGEQKDVGMIALTRGTVVEGICTRGGNPAGQIKVTIGPPDGAKPELDAQGRPKMFFSATTITGSDGTYRFPKRVPPGEYKIFAAMQAGNDNIFSSLLQMKATERPLLINPGQPNSRQNFDVPVQ